MTTATYFTLRHCKGITKVRQLIDLTWLNTVLWLKVAHTKKFHWCNCFRTCKTLMWLKKKSEFLPLKCFIPILLTSSLWEYNYEATGVFQKKREYQLRIMVRIYSTFVTFVISCHPSACTSVGHENFEKNMRVLVLFTFMDK